MNTKINYSGFIDMFFSQDENEMPNRIFSEPLATTHSPETQPAARLDTHATGPGIKLSATTLHSDGLQV